MVLRRETAYPPGYKNPYPQPAAPIVPLGQVCHQVSLLCERFFQSIWLWLRRSRIQNPISRSMLLLQQSQKPLVRRVPRLRVVRSILHNLGRTADQLTSLSDTFQLAQRDHLQHHVARRRCFHGSR